MFRCLERHFHWSVLMSQGLDSLLSALLPSASSEHFHPHLADVLTKVVLARRTDVEISNVLEPLELLHALQVERIHMVLS